MSNTIISIIVFIIVVILFIIRIVPPATAALAACCFMVLCGAATTSDVFSGFSDSNTLMLLAMLILGCSLTRSGVLDFFSRQIIRISKGNIALFLGLYLLLMFIISGFLKNTTAFVTLIPILMGIILTHSNAKDFWPQRFVFLACACVYDGGLLSLAGTAPSMFGSATTEELTGTGFSFFQFAPIAILFFLMDLTWFFIYKNFTRKMYERNGVSAVARDNDHESEVFPNTGKLTRKGISCLMIFLLVIIGLLTEEFHGYSKSVICLSGATLCLLTGCVDRKYLAENMPWHILLLSAAMLGLTKSFSENGVVDLMIENITQIPGINSSHMLLLFVSGVTMAIFSQFFSAHASVQILLPLAYAMSVGIGADFRPFAVMITVCASALPVFPTASAASMMALDWGNYQFRDYFLLMLPIEITHLAVLMFLIPILYPF